MTAILLVAASGLAREALEAIRAGATDEVVGILDDSQDRWGEVVEGIPILGGLDLIAEHPDVNVLICAGKGASRAAIAKRLALPDSRYATVIHPGVHVPASARIGAGSILLAGTVLTASVTVGRHVVAMPNVVLTHDDVIEDFATLCAGVILGGAVRVGSRAYLGMASAVRENLSVGADGVLGMGAVAVADVPAGVTCVGNPARQLARAVGAG